MNLFMIQHANLIHVVSVVLNNEVREDSKKNIQPTRFNCGQTQQNREHIEQPPHTKKCLQNIKVMESSHSILLVRIRRTSGFEPHCSCRRKQEL